MNLFFYSFLTCIYCYNILLHSGYGGRSHIKSVLEISDLLVLRGHQVKYLGLEDNLDYLKGYNITGHLLGPPLQKDQKQIQHEMKLTIMNKESRSNPMKAMANSVFPLMELNYDQTYLSLKQYILNNFDLIDLMICDFIANACIDLAKQYSIPLIVTMQTTDGLGITHSPYVINNLEYGPLYTNELSLLQRIKALIINPIKGIYYLMPLINRLNKIRKKYNVSKSYTVFGDNENYSLNLANTFTGFEPAINLQPNLHHIGPILSKIITEIENYLNIKSKVLYVGFGSLSVLNEELSEQLMLLLLKLIDNEIFDGIIISLGKTELKDIKKEILFNNQYYNIHKMIKFNNNDNIKFYSWTPQTNILNHDNVKLFLSHCGLESSFESIAAKKPILCMPLFGDQFRNTRKLSDLGISKYVDKDNINFQLIIQDILYLLNDNLVQMNLLKTNQMIGNTEDKIQYAATLIEQHINLAKLCRPLQPYKKNEIPCELSHLIPKKNKYFYQLYNMDIYFLFLFFIFSSLLILIYYLLSLTYFYLKYTNFLVQDSPKIKLF
ncbi:UDP-Glycosyltransferase/glycogen phosphorylase [Neoconidiobolus thromboides FSU 785]|nr:UDP-Glycosyltransferase/glycogen phosphorylase [Neoconidiobolus thromboides FSU 785]